MNARDELKGLIESGYGDDDTPCPYDHADTIADAILAAGYRKTWPITTFEELEALPIGSVVLDRNGLSLHKMGPLGIWNASNHTWDVQRDELEADAFPATVLHIPDVSA